MRGWRAHYPGGVTFDSSEVRPAELPSGCAGVVEFLEPPYRRIVDGGDRFYFSAGRWHATDTVWGGWVDPPEGVSPERVKRGIGLADEAWEEVRRAMLADRDWPEVA